MKFVLCHVCSLVTAFGCLAVLSNSALLADEKEKKEVKVETEVVVVSDDEGEENIAEAIKKRLREKLDGLPDDVRQKIEAKVKGLHAAPAKELEGEAKHRIQLKLAEAKDAVSKNGGEITIQAKAIIVGDDGETKVIELDGKDITAAIPKALAEKKNLQTYRVQADTTSDGKTQLHVLRLEGDPKKNLWLFGDALHTHQPHAIQVHKGDGDDKEIRVVVVKADDEESAKSGEKTITVEIKGDQILLNGKAIKTDVLKNLPESAKKRIQVRMQKEGDEGEKKEVRRRVMFFGKDGETKELDIDALKEGSNVWVEKAHDAMKKQHEEIAKKQAEMVKKHAAMVKEMAAKHAAMAKKLHSAQIDVQKQQSAHAHAANPMGDQLKEIKTELVRIRKLLEKMQDDDDDDDDD